MPYPPAMMKLSRFLLWLGGVAIYEFGDFMWMWYADIALALFAAAVNLPIREAPVAPRQVGA